MNSEIFVKATAALEEEVLNKDLKAKAKDMEDILYGTTATCESERISGGDSKDNGENKKEV